MTVGFPVKADYVTGDVLTANNMNDLSGTLNTIQSVEYAAGKNKIINGDFRINQRNFTSSTTSGIYGFDRWSNSTGGTDGTCTFSAQTFTPGAAPVAGYEASNYIQLLTSGQTATDVFSHFAQFIEDVRTFAGQTVTVSFWAKAATGTPSVSIRMQQNFGSGGSTAVSVWSSAIPITTSWARYSRTFSLASISGKTIGTSSLLAVLISVSSGSTSYGGLNPISIQNNTFQFWGVQVEASTIASDFATATGTIQGELAACQRYYFLTGKENTYSVFGHGIAYSTTQAYVSIIFPVTMRTAPTTLDYSTVAGQGSPGGSTTAATSLTINTANTSTKIASLAITVGSGLWTIAYPATILSNNSTSGYVALSAEL